MSMINEVNTSVNPELEEDLEPKEDFEIINNENILSELNIFGNFETVNITESSDKIAKALLEKYDIPYYTLINIIENKKSELFSNYIGKNEEELELNENNDSPNHRIQEIHNQSNQKERISQSNSPDKIKNFNQNSNNQSQTKEIFSLELNDSQMKKSIKSVKSKDSANNSQISKIKAAATKRLLERSAILKKNDSFQKKAPSLIGERLYRKGVAKTNLKVQDEKMKRTLSEEWSSKELTFQPNISKLPSFFKSNKENTFTRQNHLSSQEIKEKQDMEEILKQKKLKLSKQEIEKLVLKLTNEAKIKDKSRQTIADDYFSSFKFSPEVNDKSDPKLENFYNRLQTWITGKIEREAKNDELANHDYKTGQKLYKPVISKMSMDMIKSDEDIWENLFNEYKKIEFTKQETEKNRIKSAKLLSESDLISDNSKQINNYIKKNIYRKVFMNLDSDSDGVITYEDICNSEIDTKIKNILTKKEFAEKLTVDDFVDMFEMFEGYLSGDEKMNLFAWYNVQRLQCSKRCCMNENNVITYPFHPTISDFKSTRTRMNTNFQGKNSDIIEEDSKMIDEVSEKDSKKSSANEKNEEIINHEILKTSLENTNLNTNPEPQVENLMNTKNVDEEQFEGGKIQITDNE